MFGEDLVRFITSLGVAGVVLEPSEVFQPWQWCDN